MTTKRKQITNIALYENLQTQSITRCRWPSIHLYIGDTRPVRDTGLPFNP